VPRKEPRSVPAHLRFLVPALAGLALAVLGAQIATATASSGKGGFARTAVLKAGGKKLLAGGTAPSCKPGDRVSIRMRVTQGKRVAKGRQGNGCVGRAQPWQAVLHTAR
jgi:hypothetical protein